MTKTYIFVVYRGGETYCNSWVLSWSMLRCALQPLHWRQEAFDYHHDHDDHDDNDDHDNHDQSWLWWWWWWWHFNWRWQRWWRLLTTYFQILPHGYFYPIMKICLHIVVLVRKDYSQAYFRVGFWWNWVYKSLILTCKWFPLSLMSSKKGHCATLQIFPSQLL